MATSNATIETTEGARYLRRLCKHWSHKFAVSFDDTHGEVPFSDEASLTLSATDTALHLQLTHVDADALPQLQQVVVDHLQRFAGDSVLAITWTPG